MPKPKFIAIAAVSIDGKIAGPKQQSTDWTSKEDKKFLHDFLDRSDVVLVGRTTYEIARKPLSKRNCIILTSRVKKNIQKSPNALFLNPKATDLLTFIKDSGYKTVAVLGGQKVYTFCLENNLLDELFLTIEPLIFGRGLDLFETAASFKKTVRLVSLKRLNTKGSVLLHCRLVNLA